MADEFERRFLIADPAVLEGLEGTRIEQGYLPVTAPTSVRVRRTEGAGGDAAFLTIKKGRNSRHRLEFEYPIPLEDARTLLMETCGADRVCKTRYHLEHEGRTWELDRFEDANAPLLVAEIELPCADAPFARPDWLGAEVSDDPRLLNVNLSRRPLSDWPAAERAAMLELKEGTDT
jgi:CYTH domain-containing protein